MGVAILRPATNAKEPAAITIAKTARPTQVRATAPHRGHFAGALPRRRASQAVHFAPSCANGAPQSGYLAIRLAP